MSSDCTGTSDEEMLVGLYGLNLLELARAAADDDAVVRWLARNKTVRISWQDGTRERHVHLSVQRPYHLQRLSYLKLSPALKVYRPNDKQWDKLTCTLGVHVSVTLARLSKLLDMARRIAPWQPFSFDNSSWSEKLLFQALCRMRPGLLTGEHDFEYGADRCWKLGNGVTLHIAQLSQSLSVDVACGSPDELVRRLLRFAGRAAPEPPMTAAT